jgi:hypothetical protein
MWPRTPNGVMMSDSHLLVSLDSICSSHPQSQNHLLFTIFNLCTSVEAVSNWKWYSHERIRVVSACTFFSSLTFYMYSLTPGKKLFASQSVHNTPPPPPSPPAHECLPPLWWICDRTTHLSTNVQIRFDLFLLPCLRREGSDFLPIFGGLGRRKDRR